MSSTLHIKTSWLETGTSIFNRVVVLNYITPLQITPLNYIATALYDELGLNNNVDYIFDPSIAASPIPAKYGVEDGLATIRIKEEEHFIMLKLHYDGN